MCAVLCSQPSLCVFGICPFYKVVTAINCHDSDKYLNDNKSAQFIAEEALYFLLKSVMSHFIT